MKDTGKLYHHKMRLDSVLRKNNVTRKDILNYVKTKHCLYFLNDKIKDSQILKFIDRILAKNLKGKPQLQKISETTNSNSNSNPTNVFGQGDGRKIEDDDFDYLNDDDEYDEDYEDYEEPEPLPKK